MRHRLLLIVLLPLLLRAVALHAAGTPAPTPTLEQANIENAQAQARYFRKLVDEPPEKKEKAMLSGEQIFTFLGTIAGAAFTLFITNWLSDKKAGQEQRRLYERQKAQMKLAVCSLMTALDQLGLADPLRSPPFLRRALLPLQPKQPSTFDRGDDYYQKYDLVSTVYRLCALLGWMELYRTEPNFLSGPRVQRTEIETRFRAILEVLSREFVEEKRKLPPNAPSGSTWHDGVILEDEQRAVGEMLLTQPEKGVLPTVIGYGDFCGRLFRFPGKVGPLREKDEVPLGEPNPNDDKRQNHWIWNATAFIVGIGDQATVPDYRKERLKKLRAELTLLEKTLSTADTEENPFALG